MNYFKTLLFLALVCVSCDERQDQIEQDAERAYLERNLTYYYDKRTDLCFAANNVRYNNAIFTHVPCTESVLSRCNFLGSVLDGK